MALTVRESDKGVLISPSKPQCGRTELREEFILTPGLTSGSVSYVLLPEGQTTPWSQRRTEELGPGDTKCLPYCLPPASAPLGHSRAVTQSWNCVFALLPAFAWWGGEEGE